MALQQLERAGWSVVQTSAGHRWGKAECGEGCSVSIWSTPKSPGNHGKALVRAAAKCPHEER